MINIKDYTSGFAEFLKRLALETASGMTSYSVRFRKWLWLIAAVCYRADRTDTFSARH